jgi:putative transcriptional regulator
MSKAAFDQIDAGLTDALAIVKGEADPTTYRVHTPIDINARRIRQNLGLTREAFAMRFALPLGTVRDWEQNRRVPEAPARTLLAVIEHEPQAVSRALAAAAAKPTTKGLVLKRAAAAGRGKAARTKAKPKWKA